MKDYSKKNFAKRIMACALAILMCMTCVNSSAYGNFAGALFGSNESDAKSLAYGDTVRAAGVIHPGTDVYYDCGTFTLKGSTTNANGDIITLTDGWDVSDVTTMIQNDASPTLANTTGLGTVDTDANIVCYSQYLGGLQNDANSGNVVNIGNGIYNSKDVTDYKAPAAPATGITYYYLAKGDSETSDNNTPTDASDDYDHIEWTIYAWPMETGNAISYSNQDGLELEWNKLMADEALTGANSEVASDIADAATLTSLFGKSRPYWESGNIKYNDWINLDLADGTSDVAGLDAAIQGGNNELWHSSTKTKTGEDRPWLSLTLTYNGTGYSADDIDGITIAEYPLANAFPKNSNEFYKLAYGTAGLADKGDALNPVAISKTTNHKAPLSISAVEGGDTTVTYSPITLLSTLWSNSVHYNAAIYARANGADAANVNPNNNTYFDAPDNANKTGADETGKNVNVKFGDAASESSTLYTAGDTVTTPYFYKYGDMVLDSGRMQITKNYTDINKKTDYNPTGAPTGARLYGIYAAGTNAGQTSQYARVFDWETATASLKSADENKNFDTLLVNKGSGITTINVTPVFDITYDYQRAAGTVTANIPVNDPTLDTVATDKSTGTHTGLVSSSAGVVDVVSYDDVIIGHEYELQGQLYVVGDDNTSATIISGAKASTPFTATEEAGFVAVNFTFNNTRYAGKTIVVYETLVDKTTGLVVAEHKDVADEDQRIYYPSLTTRAVIPSTGLQTSEPLDSLTINDTIDMTNLVVGENYKVEGKLIDASTGNVVKNDGKDVKSTIEFEADATDVTKVMTFADVDLTEYSGKKIVIFQYLYLVNGAKSTVVYTANDKNDANETITLSNPTVSTVLAETGTDLKNLQPGANIQLTDNVNYTDLSIGSGVDYVSVTKLVDADTKNDLLDAQGNKISGEVSIEDNTSDTWNPTINLVFDGSNLENTTVVAYNYLYRVINGNRYLVVAEEDATNENQTVTFPSEPTIDTVATVTKGFGSNNKTANISTSVTITDKVEYFGLNVGTNYTLESRVFDKTTQAFVPNVSATTTFKPTRMNDTIDVDISIDTSSLAGHELVVYEVLKDGSTTVASHEDEMDRDQTVGVATPSLDTVATGATTEDHTLPATTTANLIDKVSYEGLSVGTTYILTSKVYDAETGKLVPNINPVKTTLKPQSSNGSVEVTIKVPASTLVGKKLVVFEYLTLDGNEVATHADIDDEDQTVTVVKPVITTKASDKETGKKKVGCIPTAEIEDVVTYENLEPNTAYTLTATVYNKKTGKLIDDIKPVTKSFTTGSEPSGEVTMTIVADTTNLAGQKLVIYEELKLGTIVVGSHKDIDDDNQTVEVLSPSIDTVATSETTNDHSLPWSTAAVINDTVEYENLTKGQSYTLTTEVYDKSTKKAIPGIKATSTTFTPDESNGEIVVSVTIDSSQYLGKSLVVYETLKVGTTSIVKHHDINDKDQTVTVVNPTISTVAVDSATGGHQMSYAKDAAIKDIVYYSGLANGATYTLTSTVYDKRTGLQVNGVSAVTTTFTATGFSGSTQVTIPVDTTLLSGKTLVVFETLSLGGGKGSGIGGGSNNAGSTSIKHEDLNDANQTVYVGSVDTVLMNSRKTSHNIGVSRSAKCVDTISFSGLEPGRVYTITGELKNWDAVTGKVGVADTTPKANNSTNSNKNSNNSSTNNGTTTNKNNAAESATPTQSQSTNKVVNNNGVTNNADSDEISVGTSNSTNKNNTSTSTSNDTVTPNVDGNNGSTTKTTTTTNSGNTATSSNNATTNSSNSTNSTKTTTNTNNNSNSSANNGSADGNTSTTTQTSNEATKSSYVYGSNMAETVATTTVTFVPTAPSGTVEVVFTVDTTSLQNHKLVAFETIKDTGSGAVVAEHKDIADADQTVTVGNSSHSSFKTGVEDYTNLFVLIAVIALLCATGVTGFFAYKKRKA